FNAVKALKAYAKKMAQETEDSFDFDKAHASLKKKWKAFSALEAYIKTMLTDRVTTKEKYSGLTLYPQWMRAQHHAIEQAYCDGSKTLNFLKCLNNLTRQNEKALKEREAMLRVSQ